MQRWLLAATAAFSALVAVDTGCHEPTEIVVRVTTSFDCSLLSTSGVGIRVGASPLTGATSAISNACKNGYVGSLVLTPSSGYKGQSITVEAIASLAPTTLDADGLCVEGSPSCIHARRALPYLDGNAITVPITLESSCAGVTCDPSDTCENAACVPASIDPNECKTDCSLDGGTGPAPDGGTTLVACGDMSGLLANAAMPMDRYCPGHVGYTPYQGPTSAPSQLPFSFPTGLTTMLQSPPVVIDENDDVYFLTPDGNVHAFSAKTGAQKWPPLPVQTSTLVQGPGSLVLAKDGTLYVGTDNAIIAVNRTTGLRVDSVQSPETLRSSLTSGPLGLYYAGPTDTVRTVSLNPLAIGPISPPAASQIDGCGPTIIGGKIWMGDGLGTAYTFDAISLVAGVTLSVNSQVGQLSELAVAPDGTLRTAWVDGSGGAFVAAFDSSKVVWSKPAATASVGDIIAVLSDGTTLYDDDNRNLLAFDASGAYTAYPGNGHPHFPGVSANGVVYTLNDPAGNLVAYASPTSVPTWTSSAAIQTPVWGIYIGTDHDLVVMRTTEVIVFK